MCVWCIYMYVRWVCVPMYACGGQKRMPRNLLSASPFYSFKAGSFTEPGTQPPASKPPSLCLTTLGLGMIAHAQILI